MADKSLEDMTDEEIAQLPPPDIDDDNTSEDQTDSDTEPQVEDSAEEGEQDPEPSNDVGEGESDEEGQTQEPEIDYKKFYETMMSPIKANGKTFTPRNAEEAIRLVQMGANYTRKMQGLAPYRKKIQMLKNAGLLEDEKLNYLIDLSQGNPDAVKKLLKDSKLDPLDIDTTNESTYIPSNHQVSDNEMQVQTIVDDLKSTPEGLETLDLLQHWDQASLQEIWQTPSILATLDEQRQNGVYQHIVNEMEHQKMLGNLSPDVPFLQAYKAVGNYCLQQQQMRQNLPMGTLNRPTHTAQQSMVRGAAPSGRTKKVTQQMVDPFSLSDEEFEKRFKDYAI